ncbi:hypothetical protein [Dactylosporangium sp. NPDC000521]|uniref:hypothetical protein n=1 Tax=Dactylosporangium sp. NPDC000521 TaxID=3363975 RepID=UPI0036AB0D54
MRVRGTTGRIVTIRSPAVEFRWMLTLTVTLPDSRTLTVQSPVKDDSPATREALVRAVDGLTIDSAPDVSWVK